MADTRPTKLKLAYMIYLCLLAVFCPKQLIEEEKKDNELRKHFTDSPEREHNVYIVNRAFWGSLRLIIIFGIIGAMVGSFLHFLGSPSGAVLVILQIIGASLLLWGTLFVRGWQIQTYCGVTLAERVNSWIYQALYCLGTSIVICSLVWARP